MENDFLTSKEKQTDNSPKMKKILLPLFAVLFSFSSLFAQDTDLELNEEEYFEAPGVNVLAFSNWYNGLFSDSKISGVEIIHFGERTATNGDVRLHATPEQWDAIPTFSERKVSQADGRIDTYQEYPDYDFEYMVRAEAKDDGILLSVRLEEPLPDALVGKAGLNPEFIPSAYWEKTYYMDGEADIFPLYPSSDMNKDQTGYTSPKPMATGQKLILAPEDPERRVTITSEDAELMLHDGRDKAQNGWFVVRSLLPENQTGKVLEWFISPNSVPGWTREPVIAHSQVGYHPDQKKVAVIELDKNATPEQTATLHKISEEGEKIDVHTGELSKWGQYLQYIYFHFDFSEVREPGTYEISYGEETTAPFVIGENIYEDAWYPTNDIFFPVQMDHMLVNEAYRVWHGASHLDDALQAPVNHEHFDLYARDPQQILHMSPGNIFPG